LGRFEITRYYIWKNDAAGSVCINLQHDLQQQQKQPIIGIFQKTFFSFLIKMYGIVKSDTINIFCTKQ